VIESRKRAVSVRLATAEIRKIKKLAQRLNARDTDINRFAIKTTLARVAPLEDFSIRGRSLIPVFVECGSELLRHFELDSTRLDGIINDGVTGEQRVDADDIALLAMVDGQHGYAMLKLSWLGRGPATDKGPASTLRQYLYEKYLYSRPAPAGADDAAGERRKRGA